jgi:hypothetical protein
VENLFSILTSVAVVSILMEVLLKKKIVLMKTNLISVVGIDFCFQQFVILLNLFCAPSSQGFQTACLKN